MSTSILNTWRSKKDKKTYYKVDDLRYEYGDYKIYRQFGSSYVYVYKDIAFNILAGIDKAHLRRIADKKRPVGDYSPSHFLYDQGIKTLDKGLTIIK